MANINYGGREVNISIVYYGPGLSGKSTNLQVLHKKTPPEFKSEIVEGQTDYFSVNALSLGFEKIKSFAVYFHLHLVPGQVYYNSNLKMVLRGVDGVVFVIDSAKDKIEENLESFRNLEENLTEYGYKRENIPIIIQYNKRDLSDALPIEELNRLFNKYNLPWCEAVANKGIGVFESLKLIGQIVLDYLNKKYSRPVRPGESAAAPITQQTPRPPVLPVPPVPNRQLPDGSVHQTDLDREIEKYQRAIEEKQRLLRKTSMGTTAQSSPPAKQKSVFLSESVNKEPGFKSKENPTVEVTGVNNFPKEP